MDLHYFCHELKFLILNPYSLNNFQYCKWGAFLVNFGPIIYHQFEIAPHFSVKYLRQYQFIFWRALHMYAKDWSALIDLMSMSWEGGGSREWIMKHEWLVYPSSHLSLRTRKKGLYCWSMTYQTCQILVWSSLLTIVFYLVNRFAPPFEGILGLVYVFFVLHVKNVGLVKDAPMCVSSEG